MTNNKKFSFEVHNLTVHYDKLPVLWDISLQIPEGGSITGVVGPNGAGKSTLFKTALGLIKPLSGAVAFWEKPFKKVRKNIAYLPQKESIDWDFPITVFEVVLMGRYGKLTLFQRPRASDITAANQALEMVGLAPFAKRQISELSGGQQQRLFFARALVQDVDMYLMDEPFQGIDATTEKVLVSILHRLKERGKTIIVVHHDLSSLREYFDYIAFLHVRLVAFGPIQKVLTKENLNSTFGKNAVLLEEAFQLKVEKNEGL